MTKRSPAILVSALRGAPVFGWISKVTAAELRPDALTTLTQGADDDAVQSQPSRVASATDTLPPLYGTVVLGRSSW